ncbi:hypothetical protein MMC06_000350 [Schaereria dolodes]|nr:hypothetical protein [Schaereria dolodes]
MHILLRYPFRHITEDTVYSQTLEVLQIQHSRVCQVNGSDEEIDLYEVLEIERGASKVEIKKAYHKAALSSHPDKVAAEDRASAEIRFKAVSQAYEILQDDQKRNLYDTHGMSAFDPSQRGGMGAGVGLDDILQQMFGMGGGVPSGFTGSASRRPRKGRDEEQEYEVTLEELYKGKSAKFASKKNVVCSHCKGKGGKESAKPKSCSSCQGKGAKIGLRSIGPGLVTQETVVCDSCKGTGSVFKDKDKCKKCKGNRVTEERKLLEIYIPRGSKEGERIVLEGEADQVPDQQPGDIVFTLVVVPHPIFKRSGADLSAEMQITLAEALCGFSRVVIRHLDGRGIQINHMQDKGRVLRPGQVIKVAGEGMPFKKSDMRGNLYLTVSIEFPEEGWFRDESMLLELRRLLPKPSAPVVADTVDEVDYDETAAVEDFGDGDDGTKGGAWVDEDDDEDEGEGQPQCAQQ